MDLNDFEVFRLQPENGMCRNSQPRRSLPFAIGGSFPLLTLSGIAEPPGSLRFRLRPIFEQHGSVRASTGRRTSAPSRAAPDYCLDATSGYSMTNLDRFALMNC